MPILSSAESRLDALTPEKYGAVGDGVTNDTAAVTAMFAAVPAAGARIHFARTYLTTGGHNCNNPVSITGVGGHNPNTNGITSGLLCATDGVIVLTLGGQSGQRLLRDFGIMWTGTVGAPTSGAGLSFIGPGGASQNGAGDFFNMDNVHISGFYDTMVVAAGWYYHVSNSHFMDFVRYGAYLTHTADVDKGDPGFSNCVFFRRLNLTPGGTAIRWESGGGLRVVNTKFNANNPGYLVDCIDLDLTAGGKTGVFVFGDNSYESYTGAGVRIRGGAASDLTKFTISTSEFFALVTGYCVVVDGTGMTRLSNISITGNVLSGYGGISLTSCYNIAITGNSGSNLTGPGLVTSNVQRIAQAGNTWPTGTVVLDTEPSPVKTSAYVDFSQRPNGDPSTALDTGHTVGFLQTATGWKPQVSSGRLIRGSLSGVTTGSYAAYYQATLGAAGTRIGTRYVWSSATTEGVMCIALWASVYQSNLGLNVPSSVAHFTIKPGTGATGAWSWYVCDNAGHLFIAKSGTYANPASDGSAIWYTDVLIDRPSGMGYATLPDGQIVTLSAAEVAAAFTAAGFTPVAFSALGSQVATIEHFANANGGTSSYPEFLDFWADTDTAPAFSKTVTPFALTKTINRLRLNSIVPAPTYLVYAPTTIGSYATTTTIANVDGTNVWVTATAGPTGVLLIDVRAYYEFTAADTLFWRIRETGGGTTTTIRTAFVSTASGQKDVVDQMFAFTGLTAGSSYVLFLQHSTVTAGTATLKAGGAGGSTLPPITMRVTPL